MPDSFGLQSTYSRSIVWAALLAVACGASNGANNGNAGSGGQAGLTTTCSGVAGRDVSVGKLAANTNSAGGGNRAPTHDKMGDRRSTQDARRARIGRSCRNRKTDASIHPIIRSSMTRAVRTLLPG